MWHLSEEVRINFQAEEAILEGLLCRLPGSKGVIVTHPHSLYGGDMYNPVVESICRAFGAKGYSTLRFNFRGVGSSSGSFGEGVEEARDVLAAVDFLEKSGLNELHLAGYSFGARVLANLEAVPKSVFSQLHVAPPVAFMEYDSVKAIDRLGLVIAGEKDEIAPPESIRQYLPEWSEKCVLEIIDGTDHFFGGALGQLETAIKNYIG